MGGVGAEYGQPHTIRFSVAGGGSVDSDCGQYAAIIGPDLNGDYHDIECQGVDTITSIFPKYDLVPLHEMTARHLPGGNPNLPPEVGGDKVKLLIGIRSTELSPKLVLSLPGGLCVYRSKFTDVWRSEYCFGGPHLIFTEAYAKAKSAHPAGISQIVFTEVAMAYLEGPSRSCPRNNTSGVNRRLANLSRLPHRWETKLQMISQPKNWP
jgi:hypothetical protein